jgi:integrase
MAIYRRGENWYVDFTFHGKRIREMIGPSRKGAEKVIAKRKAEIAENKFLDVRKEPDPIKFYDFAKEYLQWSKANKKPSSHIRDLSSFRALNKEFEKKTIQEITKPATINRELALIKHLYTKAIEWGRMRENPAKKVKLLKGEVRRVRYLMPDEVQKLLSNCADHLKPLVTVAVHTAMRKSELLDLKWEQVNFEQGFITLLDTKNHERRDIPMNETVKATLRGMERQDEYVFSGFYGRRFDRIKRSFHDALKKSGIGDFRLHDLRHTFASNLVMEGEDLNTVRELLGHKNLIMTLRYAHLAPGKKTKAVNILDRIMSLNPPQQEMPKKVVSLMSQTH